MTERPAQHRAVTVSPTIGALDLRPATLRDADLLLAWANDPTVRAASFRTGRIDPAGHRAWLAERLASPTTRLLIGCLGQDPIGQVRLERGADGEVEIGISVAPERRGQGLGRALLAAGLEAGRRDATLDVRAFLARVRTDNAASEALFRGAGFHLRGSGSCEGVPCLILERSP